MAMRVPLGLLLDTLIRRLEVMSLPFPFPEESLAELDANKSGNLIYSVPAPEVAFCTQEDANLVASTMELTVDTSVYDPAYYCHQLKPSPRQPSHRTVSRTQELTTM